MNTSDEISGVVLEFACHEYIDEHNYCNSCARTLIDFTCLKNEDLANAINNSDGMICGRFRTTQLSQQFVTYAAIGVMAAAISTTSCTPEEKSTVEKSAFHNNNHVAPPPPVHEIDSFFVSGVVVARRETPKPIGGLNKLLRTIKEQIHLSNDLKTKHSVLISVFADSAGNVQVAKISSLHRKPSIIADIEEEVLQVVSNLKLVFNPVSKGKDIRRDPYIFSLELKPQKK